jgi:hypothetical protein
MYMDECKDEFYPYLIKKFEFKPNLNVFELELEPKPSQKVWLEMEHLQQLLDYWHEAPCTMK